MEKAYRFDNLKKTSLKFKNHNYILMQNFKNINNVTNKQEKKYLPNELQKSYISDNTIMQLGGNVDIDYNKSFIKSENVYIRNHYSFETATLLRKALSRLNTNGIFLDKKLIEKIEKRLKDLETVEKKLSFLAENMVNAYNYDKADKSLQGGNPNRVFNEDQLVKFNEVHKKIYEERAKAMIKPLNDIFIKLTELSETGKIDKITENIEKILENSKEDIAKTKLEPEKSGISKTAIATGIGVASAAAVGTAYFMEKTKKKSPYVDKTISEEEYYLIRFTETRYRLIYIIREIYELLDMDKLILEEKLNIFYKKYDSFNNENTRGKNNIIKFFEIYGGIVSKFLDYATKEKEIILELNNLLIKYSNMVNNDNPVYIQKFIDDNMDRIRSSAFNIINEIIRKNVYTENYIKPLFIEKKFLETITNILDSTLVIWRKNNEILESAEYKDFVSIIKKMDKNIQDIKYNNRVKFYNDAYNDIEILYNKIKKINTTHQTLKEKKYDNPKKGKVVFIEGLRILRKPETHESYIGRIAKNTEVIIIGEKQIKIGEKFITKYHISKPKDGWILSKSSSGKEYVKINEGDEVKNISPEPYNAKNEAIKILDDLLKKNNEDINNLFFQIIQQIIDICNKYNYNKEYMKELIKQNNNLLKLITTEIIEKNNKKIYEYYFNKIQNISDINELEPIMEEIMDKNIDINISIIKFTNEYNNNFYDLYSTITAKNIEINDFKDDNYDTKIIDIIDKYYQSIWLLYKKLFSRLKKLNKEFMEQDNNETYDKVLDKLREEFYYEKDIIIKNWIDGTELLININTKKNIIIEKFNILYRELNINLNCINLFDNFIIMIGNKGIIYKIKENFDLYFNEINTIIDKFLKYMDKNITKSNRLLIVLYFYCNLDGIKSQEYIDKYCDDFIITIKQQYIEFSEGFANNICNNTEIQEPDYDEYVKYQENLFLKIIMEILHTTFNRWDINDRIKDLDDYKELKELVLENGKDDLTIKDHYKILNNVKEKFKIIKNIEDGNV